MSHQPSPPVLGVHVSGRGSNLQAIIDAVADGRVPARIGVVISNRPAVFALERAARAGIPTAVIEHRGWPSRAGFQLHCMSADSQPDNDRALR